MNKAKKIAVWLLILTLLILGGVLPLVTAAIQDRINRDRVQTTTMETLELDLQYPQTANMLEKLFLLQESASSDWIAVTPVTSENGDTAAQEQLIARVWEQLEWYIQTGILPPEILGMGLWEGVCAMVYDPEQPERNTMIWYLRFGDGDTASLTVLADDQTGQILLMECDCSEYARAASLQEQQELLCQAADHYLQRFDLTSGDVMKEVYGDGMTLIYTLQAGDGDVMLQFGLTPGTFRITIGAMMQY